MMDCRNYWADGNRWNPYAIRPSTIQTTFKNGFAFHSEPGQLQELLCVVASASIWYRRIKEYPRKMENGVISIPWYHDFAADELYMSDMAQLPSSLKQMIDQYFRAVENSFAKWCKFHHLRVFQNRPDAGLDYDLVNFISWRADATIDWTETAINLVKSDVLNDEERYRIACIYCLVDDVERLWPITTNLDCPLIKYWNFRMNGEQCTFDEDPESSCVEASLLKNYCAETKSAFEYLWQFLTEHEQDLKVMDMANVTDDMTFLKFALLKLNERQLVLLMSKASGVFMCFDHDHLATSVVDALVIYLWTRIKNVITNHAFHSLIQGALTHAKYHGLAFEIWSSASNRLKNYILGDRFDGIKRTLLHAFIADRKDVRLLIELLSTRNADVRERIWRNHWRRIIIGVSPEYLQQIMELCLESDDIESFKKMHFCVYNKIKSYCGFMTSRGNFEGISKFLQFCSDDPEVIFNLRMNVLQLRRLIENGYSYPKIQDTFDMFLSEMFADMNQVNEFKRNLILGEESMACFRLAIIRGETMDISNLVDRVLSSRSDLNLAKSRLLELCRDFLISAKLEQIGRKDWYRFIKWCLHDDDDAVQNFKLLLPINQIYKTLFDKSVRRMRRIERYASSHKHFFKRLDYFLEWIFMTEKAVENFKLCKLFAYKRVESIRVLLESNDATLVDSVIAWFCNYDASQIEKFKVFMLRDSNNERCFKLDGDMYWRCELPSLF
ncbi:uncharacterized protein LOC135845406 isoform X3 [Planococcus citri]|uniref:uncharacterized protein LOC135845406 isoform X3 n=1 Tax=Planococcus citri TaxID=170843 RepID=UPI0031F761E3